MTLDKAKRGQKVKIVFMPNDLIRAQALRLGIAEGTTVTCQEIVPSGPVVILRHNQEIAIGRNLARNIKVEPVPSAPEKISIKDCKKFSFCSSINW